MQQRQFDVPSTLDIKADGSRHIDESAPRFLVVDDHALMRHGLKLALKMQFPTATVIEAGSLSEAMRCARSAGDLSAVLYDLKLSDAEGLAGLKEMLRWLGRVPLVVVSGTLDNNLVVSCIRAGARGFVPKGADAEVFEHALPIIMGGGLYAPLPSALSHQPDTLFQEPSPAPAPSVHDLTDRQREILQLLLQGQSNKEIARSLGIVEGTIKVHLRSIMQRLGVRNRTQLAVMVEKSGL
ncbi:LuxR C-terminal-related transcriptional regulator [Azospirillum brasilense]|uniref:LuxR family transcriptional regulator n=1 Tax=Azospirillum brasilense TaxID=192 RepID=A0A235HFS8_AZOBR|nr:response regulator transcription factor [Azospirillum brasilense]OYD84526.1 LuxR family transcriptional regulator [Azospirillum brasilense]